MRPRQALAIIATTLAIAAAFFGRATAADEADKPAGSRAGVKMGEPVLDGFNKVFSAAADSKLLIARPTMITYEGGPHVNWSLTKTFKAQVGIVVADDTQAAGEAKVRKTEP